MKYFLRLAYNGTQYRGWQRQNAVPSIQAVLEDDLRKIFHSDLTIHGCGRTDAGVHASNYYAHFVVDRPIDFDLVYKLNRMLPDDIIIHDLLPVLPTANAQLDVISRTYTYRFHTQKNPFLTDLSALYDLLDLDLDKMEQAIALFPKHRDFRHFCLQPDQHNHTRCDLREASMKIKPKSFQVEMKFTANRFLRGMIRLIVARLLDVGRGQISLKDIEAALTLERPNTYMNQAYPQGLFLSEVVYPDHIFTERIDP